MLKVVQKNEESNAHAPAAVGGSLLDEIVRDGARQMLAAALQAEGAAYVEAHCGERDEVGHRLVVRNGHHAEREVTTAAGAVAVRAPRVNDKRVEESTGQRKRFSSAILPAWSRKSPRVAEVLPLLYLHGLSSSDFGPALAQFLGSGAGLSAATITQRQGRPGDGPQFDGGDVIDGAATVREALQGTSDDTEAVRARRYWDRHVQPQQVSLSGAGVVLEPVDDARGESGEQNRHQVLTIGRVHASLCVVEGQVPERRRVFHG